MSAFESFEEYREVLRKYRENRDYSYRDIREDYGIGSSATVTAWIKPVMDGEMTPKEVWDKRTSGRGSKGSGEKSGHDEGGKKVSQSEEREYSESGGAEKEESRLGKIILIVATVLVLAGIILISAG